MAEPNPLDPLLGDLRRLIIDLMDKHQYWEVRIHGSDGLARVETIRQEKLKYKLRPTDNSPNKN
jgi:hypothetical protein